MSSDDDVDKAYKISSPEEARRHYADWAATYDDSFAETWGYAAPREIARAVRDEIADDEPILDVGAGTGLLAAHLAGLTVDGFDISPEMLAVAKAQDRYRNYIVGDLTKPLALADASYGAVVSSGTFTHGHVGAECLPELLRITRPGALFCCGVVPAVFDGAGFGSALAGLVARGAIEPVRFREIAIYAGAEHAHKDDRGLVMIFRTKA